jgi:3-methyladenine DNA glycosylase AlkD
VTEPILKPAAAARQLLQALLSHANPGVARQGQSFFKEPIQLVGVNAATMRRLARTLYAQVKGQWSPAEALAVCERLLPDRRLDVKISALLFLACFGKQLNSEMFSIAERWVDAGWCDSWAVIDELCIDILGPVLQRQPDQMRLTQPWGASSNLWLRRAALVALVKPARRGLGLDQVFACATALLCDREDLVQKAAGWLLREAGKTDMERLQLFLNRHGKRCARTTLRYAIERFPEPVRRQLLEATRS